MMPIRPSKARDLLQSRAPERPFNAGLQQERNALAWERTSFSIIVAGALLGRYAARDRLYFLVLVGGLLTMAGITTLVWATHHYSNLHKVLAEGRNPASPKPTRIIGYMSILGSLAALYVGLSLVLQEWFN